MTNFKNQCESSIERGKVLDEAFYRYDFAWCVIAQISEDGAIAVQFWDYFNDGPDS